MAPNPKIEEITAAIAAADGLLITAGAGIGVDSGLPDFRGNEGFWRAYPALQQSGINFTEIANPAAFTRDPELAWGFYGHRLKLYRETQPHVGFSILKTMGESRPEGYFVFTSNVDGQFQRAGFDPERIVECHGSIHHLQCSTPCQDDVWQLTEFNPHVDTQTCRLLGQPPVCPNCSALARPNILMFGDCYWNELRTERQFRRLERWLSDITSLVILEIGAGHQVPTVRHFSESQTGYLIRINPRDAEIQNRSGISLAMGAREALEKIQEKW